MSRVLVRFALGTTLILHGLANAVLPMRAIDAVAPGVWAPANTALYFGAIVGFVAAGLAVLGVRPLKGLATSLAVAAGLCAVVAHIVLRSGDLWVGIVLSLVLPVAVLVWAFAESIRARQPASRRRIAGDVLGLALLAWVGVAAGVTIAADIHNVRELRPERRTRQTGDLLPATQSNHLGGLFGPRPGWIVSGFEPGRAQALVERSV